MKKVGKPSLYSSKTFSKSFRIPIKQKVEIIARFKAILKTFQIKELENE